MPADPLPYEPDQLGQLPDSGDPRDKNNYFWRITKGVLTGWLVSATFKLLNVVGDVDESSGIIITRATDDGVNTAYIRQRTSRGTSAEPSALNSGDIIGRQIFDGHDGDDFFGAGSVLCVASQNWEADKHGSYLAFRVIEKDEITDVEGLRMYPEGIVIRSHTEAERDAMTDPPTGLVIYNSTSKQLNSYSGLAWVEGASPDLSGYQETSEKNQPSGYAGLDGSGLLDVAQMPASLLGGVRYQGTWNATTNSPAIPAAAIGNKGYYYKVATAGTTSIDGIAVWDVGDWIISNGTTWDKVDSTDQVTSVFGLQGAVTTASMTENVTPADADYFAGRSNADAADRKFSFLNVANYVITKLLSASRTVSAGWIWESSATTNTLRSGTTNTEQHFERANGGLGSETEVVANNTLGSIRFRGWGVQASVGAYRDAARMIGQCRAIAAGVIQGRWTLFVANSSGTLTEVLRAHDSGINIGDAANVDASAVLELTATTRGFLAPRMTTTQRDLIASPATGLMIYNTTNARYENYTSGAWAALGGSSSLTEDQAILASQIFS